MKTSRSDPLIGPGHLLFLFYNRRMADVEKIKNELTRFGAFVKRAPPSVTDNRYRTGGESRFR